MKRTHLQTCMEAFPRLWSTRPWSLEAWMVRGQYYQNLRSSCCSRTCFIQAEIPESIEKIEPKILLQCDILKNQSFTLFMYILADSLNLIWIYCGDTLNTYGLIIVIVLTKGVDWVGMSTIYRFILSKYITLAASNKNR